MSEEKFWTYFFELFESIPRQGPGLPSSTAEALDLVPPLGADQRILDIGCGAGVQTLELARRSPARVVASDLRQPFLDILQRNAASQGLAHRISTQIADMSDLPSPDRSFDLVWSEGAATAIARGRVDIHHPPEG